MGQVQQGCQRLISPRLCRRAPVLIPIQSSGIASTTDNMLTHVPAMKDSAPLQPAAPDPVSRFKRGELEFVSVVAAGVAIEAAIQGAHLTAWNPSGTSPVLFLSKRTALAPGRAIRGGVPLVFPWFGSRAGHPQSPAHGFARNIPWSLTIADVRRDGAARLHFELADSAHTRSSWPYPFHATFAIDASDRLRLHLAIHNTGAKPMPFEAAFHSYFSVSDVRDICIRGLEHAEYLDKTEGQARKRQDENGIRFTGEVDRAYLNTRATCIIEDEAWKRRILISKEGSLATVVWNPWVERARALSDLGEDQWTPMVCVETAIAAENSVVVEPGHTHDLVAEIAVAPM